MGINFPLWSPTIGDVPPSVINELLGSGGGVVNTTISTAGNGTLTAAGLVGGQISRLGPTAAYTDTTDTAAAIITALGGSFESGASFIARLKNFTAYPQTVTAGTGVTWSVVAVVPPFSIGMYYGTVGGTQASPTVTFGHIQTVAAFLPAATSNPSGVTLATNGAGTITAAGIAAGLTLRTTVAAAANDTTDSVANILAAAFSSVAAIGASFEWTYVNNSVAAITLLGATSVTVTGQTVIPPNSWAKYLVTLTSATTISIVSVGSGYFPHSGTVTLNGVTPVTVTDANVTASSAIIVTLKTVGGTVGVYPHIATITPGTGFTILGTASDTSVYNYTILG